MCGIALPRPCEENISRAMQCWYCTISNAIPIRHMPYQLTDKATNQTVDNEVEKMCEEVCQSSFCLIFTFILFKDPTANILSGSSPSCSPWITMPTSFTMFFAYPLQRPTTCMVESDLMFEDEERQQDEVNESQNT